MSITTDIERLGTVLGVWAHPDDEAYLSAGVMALAVDAGSRVVCVTATRGELGGPAGVRERELAESLTALGVREHHWLDYRDGACADVDPSVGVAAVAAVIDDVGPDTILTFGPDGMTGHADHRAVSHWTTRAWRQSGGQARLLYATQTPEYVERFTDAHDAFDVFEPGFPLTTPPEEMALLLRLDGATLDRKLAALLAQKTQTEPLYVGMGPDRYRDWIREECFVDATAAGA